MAPRRSVRRNLSSGPFVQRRTAADGRARVTSAGDVAPAPRSFGNRTTMHILGLDGRAGVHRDATAPRESPALTDATVRRATALKRDADRLELDLKTTARELSSVASPVIDTFQTSVPAAHKILKEKHLEPYTRDPETLLGSVVSVTLGFATSFLPPARSLRSVGRALMTAVGSETLAKVTGAAVEADRKAERAEQLAKWLSEAKFVADAAYRAGKVVPSQYDAAMDIMIAIGRPWIAKIDAEDARDRTKEIRMSAAYVSAATAFIEHAPVVISKMRELTASYQQASSETGIQNEVRRMAALVTPTVLAERIPGLIGFQSDRRPEFVSKVLVPLLPGLSPAMTAEPLSYIRTVRELQRQWFDLLAPRGAPTATVHYAGQTFELKGGTIRDQRELFARIQELVEHEEQGSVRPAEVELTNPDPSWIDNVRVGINTYRAASGWELVTKAGVVAAEETVTARRFWNRMAGVTE